MNITVRQEEEKDFKEVFSLIQMAFEQSEYSDNSEQFLVDRLRKSEAFIPELSLVAEYNGEIVGHILLTRITINDNENKVDSLALAPVSVLPKFQRQGIGGMLIERAHGIAEKMKYNSIVVLGHKDYYPRFGYVQADYFNIELPYDVPNENSMVIELTKNSLKDVKGIVQYSKEFDE